MIKNNDMKKILKYPVSYNEVCEHLRVDEGEDTGVINRLIKAATNITEDYIESDIALSEYIVKGVSDTGVISFIASNFRSIVEVKVNDVIYNEWVDVTSKDSNNIITILLNSNEEVNYEIKYLTGYLIDEVDESIRTAIFLKIGELYDVDRSNYTVSSYRQTNNFERILNYYKPIRFR